MENKISEILEPNLGTLEPNLGTSEPDHKNKKLNKLEMESLIL
ncbi:hypothetical protein [Apibacter muscae]|nr:hypothetical protein [Apibacter muscae]